MTRLFLEYLRQQPGLLAISAVWFVGLLVDEASVPELVRPLIWAAGFMTWSQHIAVHVGTGARVVRVLPVDIRAAAHASWLAAVLPPTTICLVTIAGGSVWNLLAPSGQAGLSFEPLPLFVLWGVAVAAAVACAGLAGWTRRKGLREWLALPVVAALTGWALMRAMPTPETSRLASADIPVAALLAALTGLSFVVAPRLLAGGARRSLRVRGRGEVSRAPARVPSRSLSAVEPWARRLGWSIGVGIPSLYVAARVLRGAFDRLDDAMAIAVLTSIVVWLAGIAAFTHWMPSLRVLRVLPISTNRLPLLLFGQCACVYAGGLLSAGVLSITVPDAFAGFMPLASLTSVFFGLTVAGLGVLYGIGIVRKVAQFQGMAFLIAVVIAGINVFLSGSAGAATWSLTEIAVRVSLPLAVIGFLVLRATISRRGSLYRRA